MLTASYSSSRLKSSVQPAAALDKPNTAGDPAAQPIRADIILILAPAWIAQAAKSRLFFVSGLTNPDLRR